MCEQFVNSYNYPEKEAVLNLFSFAKYHIISVDKQVAMLSVIKTFLSLAVAFICLHASANCFTVLNNMLAIQQINEQRKPCSCLLYIKQTITVVVVCSLFTRIQSHQVWDRERIL